ncbi:17299_t:CDS:1, partial [Dentiscutata erythropus]
LVMAVMLKKLKKLYPHPEGIFTRRLDTVKIVKSNEQYFTNLKVNNLELIVIVL